MILYNKLYIFGKDYPIEQSEFEDEKNNIDYKQIINYFTQI